MDREENAWWRDRLIASILSGIAGYLRASASPNPQMRRLRFVWLILPPLSQLVTRLSMRRTTGPNGEPGGQLNCLPMYLLMLGTAVYALYVFVTGRKRRH